MSKRLTKQELIEVVTEQVNLLRPEINKTDVEDILDHLWEAIRVEVEAGNTVPISGFGIFEPKENAERAGRNPQSGQTITIAASKSVRFRLAAPFKARLNGR